MKMNEKDLQALKEMTGLVSEKEVAAKKQQVINTQDASVTTKQKEWIGCFVVVSEYKGKQRYGLVTGAFSHGRLGVIYSDGDTWTACLVPMSEVRKVSNDDELARAKASTLSYLKREKRSCEFISAKHDWSNADNKARFEAHYADVCKWYDYITAA